MPIQRALLSVSDKIGIVDFASFLHARGVELLSTGGTARVLRDAGLPVMDVSAYTGFPEMLDGRVKTLHPKVHGGLLGKRDKAAHRDAMHAHGIGGIDLLVVNLYPFEETVARGDDAAACIEQIDIGGPAMIRSAAKNHTDVTVVVEASDYAAVREAMEEHGGETTMALRRRLACKAFTRTAAYDTAISHWMAARLAEEAEGMTPPARLALNATLKQSLNYGENPHQSAAFYMTPDAPPGVATAEQLQGKPLSYNNINDTDAAWELVCRFAEPAVAIIKHANPCGVAVAESLAGAYRKALAADPVSAFGGIIACNRPLDRETAAEISSLFVEVVIAPEATLEAQEALAGKKKLRLLAAGGVAGAEAGGKTVKSVLGGLLVQDRDIRRVTHETLTTVTDAVPDAGQIEDMLFAESVCQFVKSNAIVLAKDGATVGIGAGQTSRVDAVRIAIEKAAAMARDAGEPHSRARGAVLASDAFFPFPDNIELAAAAGIAAILQPGGSIRDSEVTAAANAHGVSMVFTGVRHFRH